MKIAKIILSRKEAEKYDYLIENLSWSENSINRKLEPGESIKSIELDLPGKRDELIKLLEDYGYDPSEIKFTKVIVKY